MKLSKRILISMMALAMLPNVGVLNYADTQVVSTIQTYADDTATTKATKLFNLVNEYRKENGLEPFKTCEVMNTMASVRATEITDGVYLNRPDGTYYNTIFTTYGVTTNTFNQNSYWGSTGYDTPEKAFESFKSTTRQNSNMLSTAYNFLGIGVYEVNNKTYYYQLFCYSDTLVASTDTTTTATTTTTPQPTTTTVTTTTTPQPTTTTVTTTTTPQPTTTTVTTTTTPEPTTVVTTTEPTTTTLETSQATTNYGNLSDEELKAKYNLDVNDDGFVNVIDLTIIKKYLLGVLYH